MNSCDALMHILCIPDTPFFFFFFITQLHFVYQYKQVKFARQTYNIWFTLREQNLNGKEVFQVQCAINRFEVKQLFVFRSFDQCKKTSVGVTTCVFQDKNKLYPNLEIICFHTNLGEIAPLFCGEKLARVHSRGNTKSQIGTQGTNFSLLFTFFCLHCVCSSHTVTDTVSPSYFTGFCDVRTYITCQYQFITLQLLLQ